MEETMKISTEDIRIYAKALRLSNLRNNCGDIIHKAQIDKPSYMDFIMYILKAETASRQQNDLVRRMRQAKLPVTATGTASTSITVPASPNLS